MIGQDQHPGICHNALRAGIYASPTLPGFRFNVAWLWQTPSPNPQRALAWMLADAPGLSDELRAAYRELLRLLPS